VRLAEPSKGCSDPYAPWGDLRTLPPASEVVASKPSEGCQRPYSCGKNLPAVPPGPSNLPAPDVTRPLAEMLLAFLTFSACTSANSILTALACASTHEATLSPARRAKHEQVSSSHRAACCSCPTTHATPCGSHEASEKVRKKLVVKVVERSSQERWTERLVRRTQASSRLGRNARSSAQAQSRLDVATSTMFLS